MQLKGRLIEDGEFATLVFHRIYPHVIEHVWEAIATPEGLGEWLMCSQAVIDGRVGGRIEMVSGAAGYRSTSRILSWEPPRLFEYEWIVAPVPEMPQGENAIFRYELASEGTSTRLTVTYRRITRATADGFLPGLHAFLDRLEAQLAGETLPDWMSRFTSLISLYPEWSGHATDSRE